MANVEIVLAEPVNPPIDRVVLTLSEKEAVTLLHIVGSIHGDSSFIDYLYNELMALSLSNKRGEAVGIRKSDGKIGVYKSAGRIKDTHILVGSDDWS